VRDLLLNLLAEGVGIVVTVFVIDRLLQRREQRAWRPAIISIHERILAEVVDQFLEVVLPCDLVESVQDRTRRSHIRISQDAESDKVGKRVLLHLGPMNKRLKETLGPKFLKRWEQQLDRPLNPIAYLPDTRRQEALQELEGMNAITEHTSSARQRISETFDHSGNLLGSELGSMLHTTDKYLSEVERALKDTKSEFALISANTRIYKYTGENPDKLDKKELGQAAAQRLEHHAQSVATAVTGAVRQMIITKAWLEADLDDDK
jgi:hypothetical protein